MSENTLTMGQVYSWIDTMAPFDTQADFDNAGMLTGKRNDAVTGVHVALDVTDRVIDDALKNGANLIVSHHPMMFDSRKNIMEEDYEGRLLCRLIREKICLIAAHTNLDKASGGINDVLAKTIGLTDITGVDYTRTGTLPTPVSAVKFCKILSDNLKTTVRIFGDAGNMIRRVTVASGAGSDEWPQILPSGADAFVTGEMKQHHGLAISENGRVGFECGHYATEAPGIFALGDALQKWINELKYNLRVTKTVILSQGAAFAARDEEEQL